MCFLLASTCVASLKFKAKLKEYKKKRLPAVDDRREKMLLLFTIFVTTLKLTNGQLNCDIIKDQQPTDFGLSDNTIAATKRDDSDVYQVKA